MYSIFPIWTYTFPVVQLLIGLQSESRLRIVGGHKWMIALGVACHMVAELLTVGTPSPQYMWMLQLAQVFISVGIASHQCFFGLRYHLIDSGSFLWITSLTRSFMLMGHVVGAILGQVLYMLHFNLTYLFLMTVVSMLPCMFISVFCFPTPDRYAIPLPEKNASGNKWYEELCSLALEVAKCFRNQNVVFWSLFSVTATAVHQLTLTYYQTLFKEIHSSMVFNGFLMAAAYFFAGLVSMLPARASNLLARYGKIMTIGMVSLMALSLALIGCAPQIASFIVDEEDSVSVAALIIAMALFVAYHCLFEFLLVAANFQIATNLRVNRFAAIFSVNSSIQNMLQLLLQLLIGRGVLHLTSLGMFRMFAMCSVATLAMLLCWSIVSSIYNGVARRRDSCQGGA